MGHGSHYGGVILTFGFFCQTVVIVVEHNRSYSFEDSESRSMVPIHVNLFDREAMKNRRIWITWVIESKER